MQTAYRLNFSEFKTTGGYYIKVGQCKSPNFRINADVYAGTADFILNYLRQQRCGYNPYLKDSCHLHDGIIVDHPTKSGEIINVTGAWHRINADYTAPKMKNYKSSAELKNRLQTFELKNENGLNGAVLLIHPGTSEERSDKFYLKLDKLIKHYSAKGYSFKALNELD